MSGLLKSMRAQACRLLVYGSVSLFFVASAVTYYGQLNRAAQSDTYGTVYTSVALVQRHTVWLNSYVPYFTQHGAGDAAHLYVPYMLTLQPNGRILNATPTAVSALFLPVTAVLTAFGTKASNWDTWMAAAMFTAAILTAASVAVMFLLLTRLTTRRRATLIAATYAFGTLEWGISGQALWEHTGATLALAIALLAFVDRRLALAGFALTAMIACRPSTLVIAVFLLPVMGMRPKDWARCAVGVAPLAVPFLAVSAAVFGSPFHLYRSAHALSVFGGGNASNGVPTLLLSPGRGLLVYSPVLLFAFLGVAKGWRRSLYFWSAIAAAAYVFAIGNGVQWWGGESFGPRKLTDLLPLLVVLLVPAVDAIARSRWIWVYGTLLGWSVFVEVLEASATPPDLWANGPHPPDLTKTSTYWHVGNNELVAMFHSANVWPRMALTSMIVVAALGGGRLSDVALPSTRPRGLWRRAINGLDLRDRRRALALFVALVATGIAVVRFPSAIRDLDNLVASDAGKTQLGGAVADADPLGIDNLFVQAAAQYVPKRSQFAVVLPPAGTRDIAQETFGALPNYIQNLLLPARELTTPVRGSYILCYVCDTSPWDRRTHWLWRDAKGALIGRVYR